MGKLAAKPAHTNGNGQRIQATRVKRSLLSAVIPMVLLLSSLSLPAWAQTALLEQIDVVTSGYGTELKLHADQPVKHRVVSASDQRLVLELEGVVAARSVRTNFAHAKGVRHVIFQPNGPERLKLNISGQNLGKPLVQVVYPMPTAPVAPAAVTPIAKPTTQPPAIQTAPVTTNVTPQPAPAPVQAQTQAVQGTPAVSQPQPIAPAATTAPISELITPASPVSITEQASEPALAGEPDLAQLVLAEIMNLASGIPLGLIASGGGLLLLMVGLGLFIRQKWQQIAENGSFPSFSKASAPQQPTARSPFQAMARQQQSRQRMTDASNEMLAQQHPNEAAHRPFEESFQQNLQHSFQGHQHPTKANPWSERPKTQLHQPVRHGAQHLNRAAMEAGMAQVKKNAAKNRANNNIKPAPAKQGFNPYQQQAKPPANRAPQPRPASGQPQPMAFERISRQEAGLAPRQRPSVGSDAERAAILGRKPLATPAKQSQLPKPQKGEPLPGNPEVLDFLKDVANYMEQDGDKHRARQITKNLRKFR